MRILSYILLSGLLFFFIPNVEGQISFYNVYSNNAYDFGEGIVQLEDSSYVVTGSSSSFGGGSQAFLMKIDSLGDFKWSQSYGGFESESGRRVLYEPGYGFFICGHTNSIGNGSYDFYLVKTDVNGNFEWERAYGDYGWERVHDAALLRDSGVMMVGETSSNPTDNSNAFIVRTDKNGDTLWTKEIGGLGSDVATCIKQYNDSSFVIGGSFYNEDSLMMKAIMYKIMDDGTMVDTFVFGPNGNYYLNDIEVVGNKIEGVGAAEGPMTDGEDFYLWEVDLTTGAIIDENLVFGPGPNRGAAITSYDVDFRRYIGYEHIGPTAYPGGRDVAIANYNSNLTWLATVAEVAGFDEDEVNDMIRTSDGGAVVVGSADNYGNGVSSVYVMKIGPGEIYPITTGLITPINFVALDDLKFVESSCYPNPVSTSLNVSVKSESKVSYEVLNCYGQRMLEGSFFASEKINVAFLDQGVYFLMLRDENGNQGSTKIEIVR